jgi:isopenicillin-N epimerase
VRHVAERTHADVTVAQLPFPVSDEDVLVECLLEAVTPRTEFALLDHVTSPTGLILPIERLVDELHERDVGVMIDGAHAPGMLDLDVASIGAECYTGNCHKWLCAPKGAAFLHVDAHHRDEIHPLTISKRYRDSTGDRSSFHAEFDWTGTDDPTPFLCVPTAIETLASLVPEGWTGVRRHNHELVVEARDRLCEALDLEPPVPDDMIGSMAALPIPEDVVGDDPEAIEARLSREHGFEVPIKTFPGSLPHLIRLSAQLYNSIEQYERLADVLGEEWT